MPTSVSWTGPAPISPLHGSQLRVPRLRSRSTDMPTSYWNPSSASSAGSHGGSNQPGAQKPLTCKPAAARIDRVGITYSSAGRLLRVGSPDRLGFRPPMLFALVYSLLRLLLDLVDVRLRVHEPEAELLLLRHQLRIVRRQVKRPQLNTADRTIIAALSQRMNRAALAGMLVQPETVLGWHRELVRRRWAAFGHRRGPGRPGIDPEIQQLTLRMAKDNPRWGCVRVRGELLKLGHLVSATAIPQLLRRNRIGPAPLRSRQTWKAFLRAQASAIVLADFFSVDTVFLKRFYVLLYMELATRRVIWFAVTDRPDAAWVTQQARNVSWELSQLGVHARFLIHDHDAKYGGGCDLV